MDDNGGMTLGDGATSGGATDSHDATSGATASTEDRLAAWMDGYRRAWSSNDPAEIGALFSEGATYRTEPYAEPARGRRAIVEKWLELRDEPGRTTFAWEPLVVTSDVQVVEARTEYLTDPPHIYSNLWVLRLDSAGRCTEFTEWYMEHPPTEASARM